MKIGIKKEQIILGVCVVGINVGVLFMLPFIKYIWDGGSGADSGGRGVAVKVARVNLEKKEEKLKKVKIKTERPKLERQVERGSRFRLDFGVGGVGTGVALGGEESANLIYRAGEVEVDPVRLTGRDPDVPSGFVAAGLAGRVEVEVVIEADGRVSSAVVILEEPKNYQLGRLTAGAIRTWKYRPALVKGVPVRIRVIVPFIFS